MNAIFENVTQMNTIDIENINRDKKAAQQISDFLNQINDRSTFKVESNKYSKLNDCFIFGCHNNQIASDFKRNFNQALSDCSVKVCIFVLHGTGSIQKTMHTTYNKCRLI